MGGLSRPGGVAEVFRVELRSAVLSDGCGPSRRGTGWLTFWEYGLPRACHDTSAPVAFPSWCQLPLNLKTRPPRQRRVWSVSPAVMTPTCLAFPKSSSIPEAPCEAAVCAQ